MPAETANLWRRAASMAARAHLGQLRRDGRTPYSAHPARVAMTVAVLFACDDPAAIAIAWLHDVIEDSTTDYEDLLDGFGREIADAVAALSKNPALPEDERERTYDEGLEKADWRAKLVKLADVMDNMADAGPTVDDLALRRLASRAERAIDIARRDTSGRSELVRAAGLVKPALAVFKARG